MLSFGFLVSHEDKLYDQIVNISTTPEMDQQQKALALMNRTNELLNPRLSIFGGQDYLNSFRESFLGSSDVQLMTGKGACGSHVHVLGRLLQRAGIPIRIAQMRCGDIWGCHMVVEAQINGKYVVMDSLYDVAFQKPDGSYASFEEVSKNWQEYQSAVPENYNFWFDYSNVRYSNWNKIPFIMPGIKSGLDVLMGDAANKISIRARVLNVYKTYLIILLVGYVVFVALTIRIIFARKSLPA